ncbi:MAG TPA: HAD family phosphatase [Rhodocyclaceae bacterium]|nr:HAD family phosphatase [Rhodocyclaceae bacterium]HNB64185.1 HAD family phosphatase [Rhodocyclaceae bacterium]
MSPSLPFLPGDIDGVIFDMDGLLLDSERVALTIIEATAAELGLPWRHEVGLAMVGLNSRDSPAVVRSHLGADFPVEALMDACGVHYERAIAAGRIPLKPGVEALFDVLDTLGLGRVVATSTRRVRAEPKLAAVGLLPRLHGMVCGDEVSRGKPAPDIFLAAAARLRLPPARCLVLEDSNAGVRGALAAGARVVMVPDLLQPADDVRAAAVPVAASLADLADFFGRAP